MPDEPKTPERIKELADELFKEKNPDELPSPDDLLRALQHAKGRRLILSPRLLNALKGRAGRGVAARCLGTDVCITCDQLDTCIECDVSDIICGGSFDTCVVCDERDICTTCDALDTCSTVADEPPI
jgi:hypothetical protein